MDDARTGRGGRAEALGTVAVALVGLVVLIARGTGRAFEYPLWSDRDLVRASEAWSRWIVTGAEMTYGTGARLPGGFEYTVLSLPLALTDDLLTVWRFQLGLEVLGATLLGLAVARRAGSLAGALAGVLWFASPGLVDVGSRVWNPGVVAAPLGLACAAWLVAVSERSPRWMLLWGVGIGLGLQGHATVGLVGGAQAVAFLLAGAGVRGLLLGLAGGLLTLVPYAAAEVANGFENTRAMFDQAYVTRPGSSLGVHGVGPRLRVLVETIASGPGVALVAVLVVLGFGSKRLPAGAVAATVVGFTAWVVVDQQADLFTIAGRRYTVPIVPAVATLAAFGVARLVPRRPLLAVALAVAAAVAQAVPAVEHALTVSTTGWSWDSKRVLLDDLRAATGLSLPELAGRTAIAGGSAERPAIHGETGVDWLLAREGAAFPGSSPPPCLLVVGNPVAAPHGGVDGLDPATVAFLLGRGRGAADTVTVLGRERRDGYVLVRYTLGAQRCPTVLVDRYLPSDDELAAWRAVRDLQGSTAVDLAAGGAGIRAAVRVEVPLPWEGVPPDVVAALVEVRGDAGAVTARLASNQLRGRAYNDGFYRTQYLDSPALRLEGDTGTVEVPIAVGLVGNQHQLPPLATTVPVPAGRWRATLVGNVLGGMTEPDVDPNPLPRVPFAVPLPGEVVVR